MEIVNEFHYLGFCLEKGGTCMCEIENKVLNGMKVDKCVRDLVSKKEIECRFCLDNS